MLRYIKLYLSFFRICLMKEMESRGSFFMGCAVIVCFPILSMLMIGAIYSRTTNLNGWTFYEYLILVGTFMMISSLVFTLFFKNIFEMPEYIRKGHLDFLLLKPVNTQFMMTTRYIAFQEIAQIVPGAVIFTIGVLNANVSIDWWRWLMYPVFMVCGVLIAYSIWFMMVIPSIWWIKSDMAEFFFNVYDMGRYHPNMFGGAIKTVLVYIIPFGVVAATPADLLLDRLTWDAAIWTLFVAAFLMFLASRFWRFAQTRYYGASS